MSKSTTRVASLQLRERERKAKRLFRIEEERSLSKGLVSQAKRGFYLGGGKVKHEISVTRSSIQESLKRAMERVRV